MKRIRLRDRIRNALKARADRPSGGAGGGAALVGQQRPAPPSASRTVDQEAPVQGAVVDREAARLTVLEALRRADLDPGPIEQLGLWGAWRYARRVGRQVKEEIMAGKLTKQPTAAPTRKVRASALGGVVTALLIAGAAQLGYSLPEDVATEVASALIVLGSSVMAYMTRERAS